MSNARLAGVRIRMHGFSAVELIVSLAILGIFAALAVPSLNEFVNEQRLGSTTSQLVSDLNYARFEAIKRNARVLVCARATGSTACSSQPDWEKGWLVCYDADGDDRCDATAADDPNPMKVVAPLHARLRVASSTGLVRFSPVGTSNGAATLTLTGDWPQTSTRTGMVAATGTVTSRRN